MAAPMSDEELARRRQYASDEAEDAGLDAAGVALAVTAAMSTADYLNADDFEQMVADVIQDVALQRRDRTRVVIIGGAS